MMQTTWIAGDPGSRWPSYRKRLPKPGFASTRGCACTSLLRRTSPEDLRKAPRSNRRLISNVHCAPAELYKLHAYSLKEHCLWTTVMASESSSCLFIPVQRKILLCP
uniref:Uncharacterized protein n=1 Tax=Ixodes ricinus TaxID=34613 RepID=A0A0K8RDE1_IXORI